jgi:very-short-patch-repair endonuclease
LPLTKPQGTCLSGTVSLGHTLSSCDPERLLLGRAARQFGCATDRQALEAGLTRAQIRYRLQTGRFVRLGAGVLRIEGSPWSWEQQLMAGLLSLGASAVVSHRAAAALHRFDGFEAGKVEFSMSRSARGLSSNWVVHTTRRLERLDRTWVGPFACTSASRTIVDLARGARPAELERAIDSAVRDGLTSPTFLRKRLEDLRGPGRYGVQMLDELLVDAGGHSPLERAFLRLVRLTGLPRPTCQRIFRKDGKTVARVDFSFEPLPVVAEVSGRLGHQSDAERAKDARRRNELQALGLVALEFTYRDVLDRPMSVIETLSACLVSVNATPHQLR